MHLLLGVVIVASITFLFLYVKCTCSCLRCCLFPVLISFAVAAYSLTRSPYQYAKHKAAAINFPVYELLLMNGQIFLKIMIFKGFFGRFFGGRIRLKPFIACFTIL